MNTYMYIYVYMYIYIYICIYIYWERKRDITKSTEFRFRYIFGSIRRSFDRYFHFSSTQSSQPNR